MRRDDKMPASTIPEREHSSANVPDYLRTRLKSRDDKMPPSTTRKDNTHPRHLRTRLKRRDDKMPLSTIPERQHASATSADEHRRSGTGKVRGYRLPASLRRSADDFSARWRPISVLKKCARGLMPTRSRSSRSASQQVPTVGSGLVLPRS